MPCRTSSRGPVKNPDNLVPLVPRISMNNSNMSTSGTIANNLFFLYVRMLIVMAAGLYAVRIVLAQLGIEDFGIYSVTAAIAIFLAFIGATMSFAAQRFISIEMATGDSHSLKRTFNAIFVVHVFGAVLLLAMGETLGLWFLNHTLNVPNDRLNAANIAYHCMLAISAIGLIQAPFSALIISREQMWFFSLVSIVEAGLKLSVAFALGYYSGDRLVLYAILLFAASIIVFLIFSVFCQRRFSEARFQVTGVSAIIRPVLVFVAWNLFGNLALVAKNQGINILLNLFFGPIVNASHGVMTQVRHAVAMLTQSFQQALSPQIYRTYGQQDFERMHRLVISGSKLSFILLLILVVPAQYGIEYVLDLWLLTVPAHALVFIKGILIVLLIEAPALPLMNAAAATGQIKLYQVIVGAIILLNVPLSYIAFDLTQDPTMFIYVAILVSSLSAFARVWFLKRMISLNMQEYALKVVVPSLLVGGLAWLILQGVNRWIGAPTSLASLAYGLLACVIATAIACVAVGMNHRERDLLFSVVARKFQ